MSFKIAISIFISYLIMQGSLCAAELKDATLRDEDISAAVLSVKHFTRPDGLIEYVYTISNPDENKGEIDELLIDLTCDVKFDSIVLPYADGKPGYEGDFSDNVKLHTPVAIHADYGSAAIYAISKNNAALWGTHIPPSNIITGFRLISPAKPGMRRYEITPWVHYDESWIFPEDESLVPDTVDFTITGIIAAPGCPGVTEPPETALYPGATFQVEPENINQLLQYRSPQMDRFHVDAGTKEIEMHIYYGKDIDSKTFKIEPAYLKSYFNPVAGTDEKISLPLKKARNKIKLSVHTIKATGTTRKENETHHSYKDTDVFEIRVDGNKK
ncbi:MAG: hypothetical protein RQ936_01565 [Gammaproteobacteria bacterium]|nr:hypothetical protein [Gammaproteobacteria bacterium]